MAPNLSAAARNLLHDLILGKSLGGKGLKDKEIAELVGCSTRTIRNGRSNVRDFGTIDAPLNSVGRPKKVSPTMWAALKSQLACEPCMTQEEMAAFLRREFDVDVSRATLGRLVNAADWSRKVTRTVAQERNPDLRDAYIYDRSSNHSFQFVFIDESGCDRSIGTRKHGYASKGITPVKVKRFHRGKRFQILPAYTQDGVMYYEVYEGSTTTEVFEGFIERLLPHCGKFPGPRSVLLMDNASWHFSPNTMRMCDAAGVVVLPQPTYSPDLSPIEEYFDELKIYI